MCISISTNGFEGEEPYSNWYAIRYPLKNGCVISSTSVFGITKTYKNKGKNEYHKF